LDGCAKPGGKPFCFLVGIVPVIRAALIGAGGKSRPVAHHGGSGRSEWHGLRKIKLSRWAVNGGLKMAADYKNLVVLSLATLGAVLFLLTLSVSLSATANLVLRLAALALGFGAFIYGTFSGHHAP
jgi:hypothetical protein